MNALTLRRLAEWHSGFYLFSHGKLLGRITRTELATRYAGSVLGLAWAILLPLLVLTLYAITYNMILRVQVQNLTTFQYTMFIFAGLVPFLSTAEALGHGVNSVAGNRTLLTNTVFPIDLAPVKSVLLSQVVMTVGMSMLLLCLVGSWEINATVVVLPVIWLLQIFALAGVVWFLSLLNVVLRDIQTLLGLVLMTLMIVSPIAYAPENVPERIRFLLDFNPFAAFVMAYQKILVLGQWPEAWEWLRMVGWSALLFVGGGYFFSRTKKAMVDYV